MSITESFKRYDLSTQNENTQTNFIQFSKVTFSPGSQSQRARQRPKLDTLHTFEKLVSCISPEYGANSRTLGYIENDYISFLLFHTLIQGNLESTAILYYKIHNYVIHKECNDIKIIVQQVRFITEIFTLRVNILSTMLCLVVEHFKQIGRYFVTKYIFM